MQGLYDDLQGKVALVTGGGGVLCSVMARALAAQGVAVALAGRRNEPLEAVAEIIRKEGGQALPVSCDVLAKDGLEKARSRVETQLGKVDILINGAGGNHPKGTTSNEILMPDDLRSARKDLQTFFDLDPEGIQYVFNLNFLGTLLPTQVFGRGMAERGEGCVINVSSMSAFRPLTKVSSYGAAKAAVNNFTQWLAVHFSRVGIRVNAVAPGFFVTEQNRAMLVAGPGKLTPRGEKIIQHTPMGRFGEPDDLVGAVLWLASKRASGFVTGAVIPVDGGFAAFSGV